MGRRRPSTARVRVTYKVFGDRVDGTYLGIDATHAHMNMPATLMWARGLEARPVRVTFVPPERLQLEASRRSCFRPTIRWTFTAPNLQYLMDSPTELSDQSLRSVHGAAIPTARQFTIRTAVHHDATDADVDEYVAGAEKIVREHGAVFGEFPEFDARHLHVPRRLRAVGRRRRHGASQQHGRRRRGLDASGRRAQRARHRVARVLPRVERRAHPPEDARAVQFRGREHVGRAVARRRLHAVLRRPDHGARRAVGARSRRCASLGELRARRASSPGAPVPIGGGDEPDGAVHRRGPCRSIRPTSATPSSTTTRIGSAIALALDLELRERSNGKVTLDDYMRAMWRVHGKPAAAPGLRRTPYTLADARARLAEVSAIVRSPTSSSPLRRRARSGRLREAARAGWRHRSGKRNPGDAWTGAAIDASGRVTALRGLIDWGTPAFDAGLEHDDVLISVDGKPFSAALLKDRKTGRSA